MGTLVLPKAESLAYAAGIGLLSTIGITEWPLAGLFIHGRALTSGRRGLVPGFTEAFTIGIREENPGPASRNGHSDRRTTARRLRTSTSWGAVTSVPRAGADRHGLHAAL